MALLAENIKFNVGDILVASLYTLVKAKYIVIGKNELERRISSEATKEEENKKGKENIVYSLHVLWSDKLPAGTGTGAVLTYNHKQGNTIEISHQRMTNHYWSFEVDNGEEWKHEH